MSRNPRGVIEKPGRIVIISSPSGGGKSTICQQLLSPERKQQGWTFSVSYTTRQQRPNEQDGREYHFVDDSEFNAMVDHGEFAEHFQVHLYKYGTPQRPIDEVLHNGGVMILDVDVQGARRLKEVYADAISIFILPPSRDELERRLEQRGTESPEQFKVRMKRALEEMQTFQDGGFDYFVINDELEVAVRKVLSIIDVHFNRLDMIDKEQIREITG